VIAIANWVACLEHSAFGTQAAYRCGLHYMKTPHRLTLHWLNALGRSNVQGVAWHMLFWCGCMYCQVCVVAQCRCGYCHVCVVCRCHCCVSVVCAFVHCNAFARPSMHDASPVHIMPAVCQTHCAVSLVKSTHCRQGVTWPQPPSLYYTEGRVCLHVLWHIRRSQCCSVSLVGDAVTRQWRSCLLCQCLSCGRACLACAEQQVGFVNPCNGQVGYHHCWQHV
jgi:hypothetical protein